MSARSATIEVSCTFEAWTVSPGVSSLLLVLGGVVSPGWFVVSVRGFGELYYGLFYVTTKGQSSSIDALLINSGYMIGWLELQIIASLSVVMCVVGLVTTVICAISRSHNRRTFVVLAGLAYTVSGILIEYTVIRCFVGNSRMSKVLEKMNDYEEMAPFSLFISGFGGVLVFFNAVMLFQKYRRAQKTPVVIQQQYIPQTPGYPASEWDTQMTRYPAPMTDQPTAADCRDGNYLI
ncbi:hypothetical protein ScPMuIL_010820 [Solemya velum]